MRQMASNINENTDEQVGEQTVKTMIQLSSLRI
jgi:hypothetical protein